MEIVRSRVPSPVLELALAGRLDGDGASRLSAEVEEVVRAGARHVVLRMEAVTFLSSAGIRALLQGWQRMRALGGTLVLVEPAGAVLKVLELSGLTELLAGTAGAVGAVGAAGPGTEAGVVDAAGARARPAKVGPGRGELHLLAPEARLSWRAVGEPWKLARGAFGPSDGARLRFGPGTFGVGIGAFGEGFDDCRDRYGEFLAAGGAAACLPSDGARRPDDQGTRGELVPEVQVLYAVACEGGFSHLLRFGPGESAEPVPLSALLREGVSAFGGAPFGFVAVAESAGLVGASLRSTPLRPGVRGVAGVAGVAGDGGPFEHGSARALFSFTPVREHDRGTVLLAGIGSTASEAAAVPALLPFLRPASRTGPRSSLLVHVHAAVFTFRALPDGVLPLDATVASLFEEQRLVTLLHLLDDDRDLAGAGESLFLSGALWMAPLAAEALPGPGAVPP
jgi:anti-anti-sigma factor